VFPCPPPSNQTVEVSYGPCTQTATGTVAGITTETVATIPANRQRTTIGIGEEVVCSIQGCAAVTWSVTGGGSVSPTNGSSTTFAAPESPSTSTVHAKVGGVECTVTFGVIPPDGFTTTIASSPGLGTPGTNEVGQYTVYNVDVTPASVSFYNVSFRENFPYTNSWVWPDGTAQSEQPAPQPWSVGQDNHTTDDIRSGPYPKGRLYNGTNYVSFSYTITWQEQYQNESRTWVTFVDGETKVTEYNGSTLQARGICRGVPGNWQGPWQ
jgi:hypothetical protein